MVGIMKRKQLTGTDLVVSSLCLGTADYGCDVFPQEKAWQQLDSFLDLGGNFVDTAHVYSDWIPGERARSEHVIGRWFQSSHKRNHVILSTKGAHPTAENPNVSRVNPACIRRDLEESLQALGTDYIDMYFLHRDDSNIPVEELLGCLEEARGEGKIRWYGCSNWTLKRVQEADRIAVTEGFSGFICNQIMWSLADINKAGQPDQTTISMDQAYFKYHESSGKNVMAYAALARAYLGNRIKNMNIPPVFRQLYDNTVNEQLLQLILETGLDPNQFALAYLMHQPFCTIPIVGFRSLAEMEVGVSSTSLEIPQDLMERINGCKNHSL